MLAAAEAELKLYLAVFSWSTPMGDMKNLLQTITLIPTFFYWYYFKTFLHLSLECPPPPPLQKKNKIHQYISPPNPPPRRFQIPSAPLAIAHWTLKFPTAGMKLLLFRVSELTMASARGWSQFFFFFAMFL